MVIFPVNVKIYSFRDNFVSSSFAAESYLADLITRHAICYFRRLLFYRHTNQNVLYFLQTSMTLSLVESYGLMKDLITISPRKATREELETFHSRDYLEFCDKTTNNDDLEKLEIHSEQKYGVEYDCPLIPDLMNMIQWLAGGSLCAAEALVEEKCKVNFSFSIQEN